MREPGLQGGKKQGHSYLQSYADAIGGLGRRSVAYQTNRRDRVFQQQRSS